MPSFTRHELPPSAVLDTDALTVAMAIAPGVYSRNRFFDLFRGSEVRRARRRASLVRGIVQHLAMLQRSHTADAELASFDRLSGHVRLRYRLPALHLERRVDLTELETSCVLHLAERAGLRGLTTTGTDRDGLYAALRRLKGGEPEALLR
jgi:hypothetical protein